MTFEKLRHSEAARLKDRAAIAAEEYTFFVAGPYIKIDECPDHKDNAASSASALRYFLCKYFDSLGVIVYLGEDVVLRDQGVENFGKHSNAVLFERHYIVNHIDGLIVLPSSPGSFCETGDWVSDPEICRKTLYIIDAEHEGKQNYINEGVARFGKFNGAVVEYLDYKDTEAVKQICDDFFGTIKAMSRRETLYGRR